MKRGLTLLLAALGIVIFSLPLSADIENGGFESGGVQGWTADPNWTIMDNGSLWYSGWHGKYWAWSGGKGEPATGKLRSRVFTLDKSTVKMMISGWSSIRGTGSPRKWNYITLNLADGTEIDRVYAPDMTQFASATLDGSKYKGKQVYIEAVDDADQPTFSMLCIDDVHTAELPADYTKPVPTLPAFDPKKSIKLEDNNCLVEVDRSNGSVTRIRDKKGDVDLILEPRLAGSYRFSLVIPGREPWQALEANWIYGKQQKLSSCKIDGGRLTLRWDSPLQNYLGEKFDASVTETIELKDGGVLLSMKIDNPTHSPVGETYFPVIGGIQGLGKICGQLKTTVMVRPGAGDINTTADIFRVFNNMSWLGDQGPEQFYSYPDNQPQAWVEFDSPKAGRAVYVGAQDHQNRQKVIRLELVPASSGTAREDGNWPRPEELKGLPAGVELSFVDTAGIAAGKTYEASPVFIKFHPSDSKLAREIYTGWKAEK